MYNDIPDHRYRLVNLVGDAFYVGAGCGSAYHFIGGSAVRPTVDASRPPPVPSARTRLAYPGGSGPTWPYSAPSKVPCPSRAGERITASLQLHRRWHSLLWPVEYAPGRRRRRPLRVTRRHVLYRTCVRLFGI